MINRGHKTGKPGEISSVKGVAWIPDSKQSGMLKVRFFWPFAADYWILYLDDDYTYALVGGPSNKYLWILSREKRLAEKDLIKLTEKASGNGYDVTSLIMVDHDCN